MGRARRGPVDGRWGRGIRRPGKQRSDERPVPSELAGSFAEGLANGFGQNGFKILFCLICCYPGSLFLAVVPENLIRADLPMK